MQTTQNRPMWPTQQKKHQQQLSSSQPQRPPALKPLDHATLENRRKLGFLNVDLEAVITEAYAEAGVPMPVPPKPTPRYQSRPGQSMTWSATDYGTVVAEIQRHKIGPVTAKGINASAQILLDGKPEWLTLQLMHKVPDGVKVLFCQDGKILNDVTETDIPFFRLPVFWRGNVPHCGEAKKRDVSVILVAPDATLIQLEFAVTTRNNRFWLSVQELYAGQVARTTAAVADRRNVVTVDVEDHIALLAPLYPECNYPGADFLKTGGMVHGVVAYAVKRGNSKPLSQCSLAKWETIPTVLPAEMEKEGWVKATVLFFNFAWGMGFVRLADGTSVHVHFSKIVDQFGQPVIEKGEFPIIHPMTEVAIRYAQGPKGLSATAVRELEKA